MKYIKEYEFFKPIKVNNAKPFKVKKNLAKSIQFLQKRIKSLRSRLDNEESLKKRSEMNREISNKIQKLSDLTRYQLKQAEHLKNNTVTENNQTENIQSEETKQKYNTLLELLESEFFEPKDIIDYIGIDEKKYEIPTKYEYGKGYIENVSDDGFSIVTNFNTVEYIMNVDNGIFNYLLSYMSSYGVPEYYVDDDELNYLHHYLPKETLDKIQKLADIFDYQIDIEEDGEIVEMFKYLGLEGSLEDFKIEISHENERAIEKVAHELLKSLPFEIDHSYGEKNGIFDCELSFNYDEMVEFIKKQNKDVSTIEEFLESISNVIDIGFEFEEGKYEYLEDFTDLIKETDNILDKYIENPDDIFIKLIEVDNIELFKNKIDLAFFDYKYEYWFKHVKKYTNIVEMAILYDNSITKWMFTNEFKSILKEQVSKELYDDLTDKLLNFEYKVAMDKYNL